MVQKLLFEPPKLSSKQRQEIAETVEHEINRTLAGIVAWGWMRHYVASLDVGAYTRLPQQFPVVLSDTYERLVK